MKPKNKKALNFAKLIADEFDYWCEDGSNIPYLGDLSEDDTITSIITKLHNKAYNYGILVGENNKVREIQSILRIK